MKKEMILELTKAELEVMQIVWEKGHVYLSDIYEGFPEGDNRPAYTTISTFVRILTRKGYLGYTTQGKTNRYYPMVSKTDYTRSYMHNIMQTFFDNSPSQLISFFAENGKLSATQFEELKEAAEKILNK